MFRPLTTTHPGHIGAIHTNCDVLAVVQDAYDNAKFLCEQNYLCSPNVEFVEKNSKLQWQEKANKRGHV
jgi:pyruvate dehydrogenase kinase 2/3/4